MVSQVASWGTPGSFSFFKGRFTARSEAPSWFQETTPTAPVYAAHRGLVVPGGLHKLQLLLITDLHKICTIYIYIYSTYFNREREREGCERGERGEGG